MYQQAHCSATINRSPLAHYTHTFLSLSLGVWAVLGEREKGKKEERASRRPTNATETKPNQATITSPSPSPSTLPSTQAANQPNRLTAECHVVVKVMVMERERERERERENPKRYTKASANTREREREGVTSAATRSERNTRPSVVSKGSSLFLGHALWKKKVETKERRSPCRT